MNICIGVALRLSMILFYPVTDYNMMTALKNYLGIDTIGYMLSSY